jgi:hypothetical protein
MQKLLLLAIVALTFSACSHTPNTLEKRLYGKWMSKENQYNRERYTFKPDGTFTDPYFSEMMRAESWYVADNKLYLRYKYKVLLFSFHRNSRYNIATLNDSVLTLATRGTKHYPARNYVFKKMKLNGKFITVQ